MQPTSYLDANKPRNVVQSDSLCRARVDMANVSDLRDGGGHLWFDAPPADRAATDGFSESTEEHHVHHLAVVEALKEQRREETPILILFESKCHDAGEEVDEHKDRKEDQGAFHVLKRPELRQTRDAQLSESPKRNRQQEKQIDNRRDQRQQNLKQENIRYRNPSESSVARLADRVAVLPDGLQCAEGPAEALANQSFDGLGNFGAADCVFIVENFPTFAADREREVGIFSDRVA